MNTLLFLSYWLFALAFAQNPEQKPSEIPRFELSDLGVQLVLDESKWSVDRWTKHNFEGQHATKTDAIKLFVWASPFQLPLDQVPESDWGDYWTQFAVTRGGLNPKLAGAALTQQDPPQHQVTVRMSDPTNPDASITLLGASRVIGGRLLHLALLGRPANNDLLNTQRDTIGKALVVNNPPAELGWGAQVSGTFGTATLTKNWREPLEPERAVAIELAARAFRVGNLKDCLLAVHPTGILSTDLLVGCQQTHTPVGIVDDYTYAEVVPKVGEQVSHDLELGEPQRLDVGGGVIGMYYTGQENNQTYHLVAVPNQQGIATFWAKSDLNRNIADSVKAVAQSVSYQPSVSPDFRTSALYYLKHRPTHPLVLLCVAGAAAFVLLMLVFIRYGAAHPEPFGDQVV